jgi:probable F420-dependent oxidoreductase
MKYWVTYPISSPPYDPAYLTKAGLAEFVTAAEGAGIDGIGFTDHPAPSDKWLNAGGHDAFDPFAALAFCAALTERILLIPNIVVLPYRNPFIVAKTIATIDALSGGRFILGTATGYLRAEYNALGVDYDERNDLFDEAVEVMNGIWTEDNFAFTGRHFEARGQTANPKPAKRPPLWIGGNSKLSRRRVARYGDGWCPFPAPKVLARTTKTPGLETVEDLQGMLDHLWTEVEAAGREPADIDVAFFCPEGGNPGQPDFDASAKLEAVDDLAQRGVTWTSVGLPSGDLSAAVEAMEEFGTTVINGR